MARILVVGSVNPEIIMRYGPSEGTKVRAESCTIQLGGTAYNVAAHLARLCGAQHVLPQLLVGNDIMGAVVHDHLGSIGGQPLWWRPQTAVACILLPKDAKHLTVGFKQAASPTPDRVQSIRTTLERQKPGIVFIAGLMAGEEWIAEEHFKLAARSTRVFCPDVAACGLDLLTHVINATDILVLNEEEAQTMFGVANVVDDAVAIGDRMPCSVVITRAERGAVIINSGGDFTQVPVPRLVEVKRPVGAGDAFIAMFLFQLMRGVLPELALAPAVEAGTRHVAGDPIAGGP